MWELPHAEWSGSKGKALSAIEAAYAMQMKPSGKPSTRTHAIMDYRLTLAVQPCTGDAQSGSWFTLEEAKHAAIASATRKLLDCLD